MWYYNRYIEDLPEDQIPPKPDKLEVDEVTLPYVDFGFMDKQMNWVVLSMIEFAEREYGNPKYFKNDDREKYMDWAFEDARWKYGMMEAEESDIRNAIGDYLSNVREWNDGEYVHPWSFI